MKKLFLLALTVSAIAPTLAQEIPNTAVTITQGEPARAIAPRRALTTRVSSEPDWFNKIIRLDIKNATLEEAIRKVLDAAGVRAEKIENQLKGERINRNKLSLKLDDANARDAMAAVARLYGAQAFVLSEDDKTTIELRNRSVEPTVRTLTGSLGPMSSFPSVTGFSPGGVFISGNKERYQDLPEKSLDIKVKEGTVLDVIKQICEKAGLDYEIEDAIEIKGQVSITMSDVSVGNALDNAAGWLGGGWKAERKGNKTKILFGKKYSGPGFKWSMGPGGAGQVFSAPTPGVALLPDLPIVGSLFRSTLPNKRVSLDKKNADVRECLKDILKQADLSFALADDLPSEAKSFTFSNVPIATALDMICESIEVGWTAERSGDGKPLVRVGKRYKSRSGGTRSSQSREYESLTRRYAETSSRYLAPTRRIPVEAL